MIKKLLKKLITIITTKRSTYNFCYGARNQYNRDQIEEYLASSVDLYDLEYRIKELDRKGIYNRFK